MVDVLFSFLCVLISIRCLGCSFKEIFRTLKDFLLLLIPKNISKFRSNFSKISSFSSRFFLPKKNSSQKVWQDGVFLDVGLSLYHVSYNTAERRNNCNKIRWII